MATILWPLLITVLGLLVFVLAGGGPAAPAGPGPWYSGHIGKIAELGRIAYFCGLLWVVYLLTPRAFHF